MKKMQLSPLLTDYYQLTMAQGYWQLGRAEQEAVFQLTFRKNPFDGNYTIACGLRAVIDYLQNYYFSEQNIDYLRSLKSSAGKPFFANDFLNYLAKLKFTCDIDAIPEGTIVFPQEPLLRIKGPLLQCQLLETPLINLMNFSSLVATRAAEICHIAQNDPVMEFGLRRSQGPDGGLTASYASYIGGCESTSNVLAGEMYGIPVKGTMAHSWVMSYPDEYTSFLDFVRISDVTILLVDTYNSIEGVKNAIQIGKILRQEDRDLMAIRLDSGDLLTLSKRARRLLDDAGFTSTKIIASGDLNAKKIAELKKQKAPIDIWGVGTKLVTAYEQPSLDAIYKLTALHDKQNQWEYKMKLSDSPAKMTFPGILQVRRYYQDNKFIKDILFDEESGIKDKKPDNANLSENLLIPVFRQGKLVYEQPNIEQSRQYCMNQVNYFLASKKKKYDVQIEAQLKNIRDKLTNKNSAIIL